MLRRSRASFAVSLVILPLNAVTGVLLARTLGPSGRGALAAVLLWSALAQYLGNLGVPGAVAYFVAREHDNGPSYATTGLVLAAVLGTIIGALAATLMPLVLHGFGTEIKLIAMLNMVTVPLGVVGLTGVGALQGASRFTPFNALRLLPVLANGVGLASLALLQHLAVATATAVYVLVGVLTVAATLHFMRRADLLRGIGKRALVRPLIVYGLKAHTGTVSSVANDRADQALISIFLTPSALGYYTAAVAVTALIMLFGSSLAPIAFPAIAGLAHDPLAQRIRAARLIRATFVLSSASAVIMLPLTPVLVRTLFGAAFSPAVVPAQVLLVAAILNTTNRVVATCLNAIGQPLQSGYGEVVAAVVTVVGLALLIPSMGIMGAAITSVVAYAVTYAVMINRLRHYTSASYADFLVPRGRDLRWALDSFRFRR